jgi:hypothetical protein
MANRSGRKVGHFPFLVNSKDQLVLPELDYLETTFTDEIVLQLSTNLRNNPNYRYRTAIIY